MRILFVAHAYSIHTVRWISQLLDERWDIHLVPVNTQVGNFHPDLRDITVHTMFRCDFPNAHPSVKRRGLKLPGPLGRGRRIVHDALRSLPGNPTSGASRALKAITSIKPDVIHSMEWGAGEATLGAYERFGRRFPPWIHSSWGNDLFHFGKRAQLSARVRLLMASCGYLMADCQRELDLAPGFGFTGEPLGVFSAAGGFHTQHMQQFRSAGPSSSRRLVMLKGRQEPLGGRPLVALEAMHACASALEGYEVCVFGASESVVGAAQRLTRMTGLQTRILPPFTPHDEMMKLMGRARASIGLSLVDGTPHAMLEAMVMGALPIQSNGADTSGWIEDGRNGFVVPTENVVAVESAIRRAVADDRLVDAAADINARLTRERIDIGVVRPRVIDLYTRISGHGYSAG